MNTRPSLSPAGQSERASFSEDASFQGSNVTFIVIPQHKRESVSFKQILTVYEISPACEVDDSLTRSTVPDETGSGASIPRRGVHYSEDTTTAFHVQLHFSNPLLAEDTLRTSPPGSTRFSLARLAVKYPEPAFRNLYEPICGTGESAWELYCRAARAVEKITWRGAGRYLVVAHGGILNAAMRTIIGIPPRGDKPDVVFGFGNLGYARTKYRPERHVWRLLEFSGRLPPVN